MSKYKLIDVNISKTNTQRTGGKLIMRGIKSQTSQHNSSSVLCGEKVTRSSLAITITDCSWTYWHPVTLCISCMSVI